MTPRDVPLPPLVLPDPATHPTINYWPALGQAFGLGRSAAAVACRQATEGHPEVLPVRVLRINRRYLLVTAELRDLLYPPPPVRRRTVRSPSFHL